MRHPKPSPVSVLILFLMVVTVLLEAATGTGSGLLDDLPQTFEGLDLLHQRLEWLEYATPAMLRDEAEPAVQQEPLHAVTQRRPDFGSIDEPGSAGTASPQEPVAASSHTDAASRPPTHGEASTGVSEPATQRTAVEELDIPRGSGLAFGSDELAAIVVRDIEERVRELTPPGGSRREPVVRMHQIPAGKRPSERVKMAAHNIFIFQAQRRAKSRLLEDIIIPGRCRISFSYIFGQERDSPSFLFDTVAFPYRGSGMGKTYIGILEIQNPPPQIETVGFHPTLISRLQALERKNMALEEGAGRPDCMTMFARPAL
ncbi:uncharacterized protein PFL1_02747 [Pseudozyma flocculosa PF-1]|uniref:SUN domain-containing protein n=1 Tax=Pseudozyma flocculosa PF-1 TaxID=1277687 RepID=A0A061HAB2_9BASI|nr:uncharacterized protein PFL1_02747 [Pseudozyma flocculosa PF-1]EPQ29528.1 hypothetical protein PFL1_02747 [Pseudozyma flocculosa PF-1]